MKFIGEQNKWGGIWGSIVPPKRSQAGILCYLTDDPVATGISQPVQTDGVSGLKSLENTGTKAVVFSKKKKKTRLLKRGLFH